MQKSPLVTALQAILLVSVLASLGLFFLDVQKSKQLRSLQVTTQQVNASVNGLNVLAAECAEYGKKNPAIMPIIQALAAKPASATAPKAPGK
jgi:hypothetical protein